MRGLLGVGAAALDDHASGPPRLDHGTGFFDRRGRYDIHTLGILIKPSNRARKRSARIFSACLANRGAVHITSPKAEPIIDAVAPFRSTHPLVAAPVAALAASSTMVDIRHDVRAHASTCRSLRTCKRQRKIPMDLVRRLIVELGAKDLHQIHPLKVDRLGLVHSIPRYGDRIGAFLARRHEWAVPDHSTLIRESPTDNIIDPVGVGQHSSEDDGLSGGDFRDIRLEAEEHGSTSRGCRRCGVARRRRFARVVGLAGPGRHRTRARTRGHGLRGRDGGVIVSTARRKDPREEHEWQLCAHISSMPGVPDLRNPQDWY